ncbi:MAG: bifunctional UDP-N-acetylmuramoyl-tripeptide:D-alanyl-D-alanine ligase/alanine racemase [Bacteroidales bacterium]
MDSIYFTIAEIALLIKADFFSVGKDQEQIFQLLTDSRRLEDAPNTLFVALVTKKNDGHKYVVSLYQQGVRHFLVSQMLPEFEHLKDADFLKVSDTLVALQTIAAKHREKFHIPVLGITGSNGKTIIKEWIASLLEEDKKVVKSPKSYNSQVGVPLSVWEIKSENDFAIFEAGISEPEEMEKLVRIIQPTIGIFTNIGSAHDEYFLNLNQKVAEKLKLFSNVQLLIYCADHFEIKDKIYVVDHLRQMKSFTWSLSTKIPADLNVIENSIEIDGFHLKAMYHGKELLMEIPFSDQASLENTMHCWAFMLSQGYDNEVIRSRMKKLQPVEMRMEMKEGVNHCFIINDSYSSDLKSFAMAVDFLCNQKQNKKKCLILSDILQSGRSEEELYAEIAEILRKKKIDFLIGIGPALLRQEYKFVEIEKHFYLDTETFLKQVEAEDFSHETVLLKGARLFEFEKIGALLQKKVHETVMEINMNALIHNFDYFRSLIKPSTRIMIMGKAFSYGNGSHEIAASLEFHRSDYITVAYPDEGVTLRKNGITIPIMVMNPEEQGMDKVLRFNLEPEIYSFYMLNVLRKSLNTLKIKEDQQVYIHIKLDTGMHRLGFESADLPLLISELQKDTRCHVRSVFTHLATADDASMDKYTLAQLQKFTDMSKELTEAFSYPILRHALNTAGICRFPDYQFDMVRLGIGLYGVGFDKEVQTKLETVSTLKTVIAQIRHIAAGEAVGYNRQYIADSDKTIGVIGIGYADGLNRHLGNGRGCVLVRGCKVPIIGNICMDMCMVDLTGVPAQEKDEVIIFGQEMPISEIANTLNTISYEVLTGISPRVKRVYYQE